jgi:Zn-dependent peptidase ImmA (M78 family)
MEPPPADFRTGRSRKRMSMETILAIEEVTEALDAFDDIANESDRIVPVLSIGRASLDEDPETVAARERKRFGVSVEEQQAWKHGTAEARSEWRRRIEAHGVFTYIISMPPDELSGFSMFRDGVAGICVNDSDSTNGRKIFTMFHEYGHLLLRQTGVSDENNTDHVERFCNQFAASFLIPRNSLIQSASGLSNISEADVKRLASRFRVSNAAMALRLEKTGLAQKGFYARHAAHKWDPPEEEKKPVNVPPGGKRKINYVNIRLKRIGKLHARTVFRALDRNIINSFDASELIGVQPGSFPKVQAALG